MANRTAKSIFFYEFVFFLILGNFALIGITYSLLNRNNILEEFSLKVCTSLLLILIAEKCRSKHELQDECIICYEKMNDEWLILKCGHIFHENCLWRWVYNQYSCPICHKKMSWLNLLNHNYSCSGSLSTLLIFNSMS